MSQKTSQLITMPQRTCDKCDKTYSSRQTFSAHLKTCGQKKRRGRPPTKHKEDSSEEEEEDEYAVRDEEEEEKMPPPKKKKVRLIIHPNWKNTFQKTKKMLEEKRSEDEILSAIKFDDCFSDGYSSSEIMALKEEVVAELNKVKDPHRLTKQKINRDFRTLDEDKKEQLKSILNVVIGVSVEKLEEWKIELENELYYVEYGLVIRKLYPTTRALEMMIGLFPPDEEKLEDIDLGPSESQQYVNLC